MAIGMKALSGSESAVIDRNRYFALTLDRAAHTLRFENVRTTSTFRSKRF